MKSPKSTLCLKSFEEMKHLLKAKSIFFPDASILSPRENEPSLSAPPPSPSRASGSSEKGKMGTAQEPAPESDEKLFKEAMEGVTPIPRPNFVERGLPPPLPEKPEPRAETEPLLKLKDLVQHGMGFEVADTPEYIEGTLYRVPPDVARRLHQGDFSIQAYINLHRFKVAEAREAFERFVKWSVTTGKTGVLIVHGRGLSSPLEPVLKQKVVEWLTRGPWRKWVVAYATARSCDGGAGATYVLLRRRPVSKRLKKWG
jgi:DNA-nicking Smr family endonuclease